jgi:hypothetical protein
MRYPPFIPVYGAIGEKRGLKFILRNARRWSRPVATCRDMSGRAAESDEIS